MGTNYYFNHPKCEHCGLSLPRLHIGKSSGGWCFSLHVTDEIKDLEDWKKFLSETNGTIEDEYGREISLKELLQVITERSWMYGDLNRHTLDGWHCIAHGKGTWDLITGEFS